LATRSQRFRRDRHESFPRTGLRTSIRFLIRALPADSVDGDSVWFVHLTQRRTSKPFTILFWRLTTTGGFPTLRATATELAANASGGKLTFDIVFALWFASGGLNSMISALNLAYRVREARPWFEVRTIALGLTIMISILLFTALFFVLVSSHFVDWLGTELRLRPMVVLVVPIWKTIRWPAVILFVTMLYSAIYYFGPDLKARQWHWITPGSAFGAFLWLLASVGFRTYLHFFNTFSVSYGSLGAFRLLLAWLYVNGLAFLIGGEINAEIERAATGGSSERTLQ